MKKIYSKTGRVSYSDIVIHENHVSFKRDSTDNYRVIYIDNLFAAYRALKYMDTVEIRQYINHWVYSPACAILIAMDLYDNNGKRIL